MNSLLQFKRLLTVVLCTLQVCGCAPEAVFHGLVGPQPISAVSRSRQPDPRAFYHQPIGLADDYPEESATMQRVKEDFDVLRRLNIRDYRFAMGWDGIEKSPGVYDWHFWDAFVHEARVRGIRLLPYVCYTPEWAAVSKKDAYAQPPARLEAFGDFMYVIASRYRHQIGSWELWNEPDNAFYWKGNSKQFARMMRYATARTREADPGARIVIGGFTRVNPFTRDLLEKEQIGRQADVINVHGYLETWEPERTEYYPQKIREFAALTSPPYPTTDLWVAEFGYSSTGRTSQKGQVSAWVKSTASYEHTPYFQAVTLWRSHILVLSTAKVSLTTWYRIHDLPTAEVVIGDVNNRHLGILDVNGKPKPAYYALAFYSKLFQQPVRVLDSQIAVNGVPGIEMHAFELRHGGMVLTGWAPKAKSDETVTANVALPGSYRRVQEYSVCGQKLPPTVVLSGKLVSNVRLTGGDVFIAVLK